MPEMFLTFGSAPAESRSSTISATLPPPKNTLNISAVFPLTLTRSTEAPRERR